jgi:hypothetical protein
LIFALGGLIAFISASFLFTYWQMRYFAQPYPLHGSFKAAAGYAIANAG